MEGRQVRACLKAIEKEGLRRFGKIDEESELGQFLTWGHNYLEKADLLGWLDRLEEERGCQRRRLAAIRQQRMLSKR